CHCLVDIQSIRAYPTSPYTTLFRSKIWEWKAESGGTITRQMRRLGNSVDWERERFTMDEGLSNAVKEVFVRLYKEDLIYRGKRRSEEHTSELQSRFDLVCRLLLE